MIKIPKSICKECGKCCHGEPGDYVWARTYKDDSPQISERGKCQYLNRKNECKLGCRKPLECTIYPIRIFSDGIYVDKSCPGYQLAIKQWNLIHSTPMAEWRGKKESKYERI